MKRTHIPRRTHVEHHFTATETVRDIVIGMSDGLTVPFALAAGISGAIAVSHIIVTAGVAELAAGGISMGLGGYLAARTDFEHYGSERARELEEVRDVPDEEAREVAKIFRDYGLSEPEAQKVTNAIISDKTRWVKFMMRFELQLEEPDQKRAPVSALTIGASYVLGGIIPLLPYMLVADATHALYLSAAFTLIALFAFGAIKGRLTGLAWIRSALQTVAIGGIAAAVAFAIARLVNGGH